MLSCRNFKTFINVFGCDVHLRFNKNFLYDFNVTTILPLHSYRHPGERKALGTRAFFE